MSVLSNYQPFAVIIAKNVRIVFLTKGMLFALRRPCLSLPFSRRKVNNWSLLGRELAVVSLNQLLSPYVRNEKGMRPRNAGSISCRRTRLSRRRMIWLLSPPLPSASCLFSVFLYVAGRGYREGEERKIIRRRESLAHYKSFNTL
jgi:hypothetical protein